MNKAFIGGGSMKTNGLLEMLSTAIEYQFRQDVNGLLKGVDCGYKTKVTWAYQDGKGTATYKFWFIPQDGKTCSAKFCWDTENLETLKKNVKKIAEDVVLDYLMEKADEEGVPKGHEPIPFFNWSFVKLQQLIALLPDRYEDCRHDASVIFDNVNLGDPPYPEYKVAHENLKKIIWKLYDIRDEQEQAMARDIYGN